VDISDIDRELARLEHAPDHGVTFALEAVLATVFTMTQTVVHVETGALKASGTISSDYADHQWSGQVEYGSSGRVEYARYEMENAMDSPKYGGMHNYMRPAEEADALYSAAFMAFLRGEV
jgi:hypothetical protein